MDFEKMARDWWNHGADEYNQWGALSGDEQSMLVTCWSAAFAAGREAMKEDAAKVAETLPGYYDPRERWHDNPTPRQIAAAIRALPGKEGE